MSTENTNPTLAPTTANEPAASTLANALAQAQQDKAEREAAEEPRSKLSPLARDYIARGVESLTRMPSPNLKSADYRATLLHWRAVMIQCLGASKTSAQALTVAVQAIASSEGTLQAKRLVDNVMGQVLWTASVDIDRAENRESRTAGDIERVMRERIGAFAHDGRNEPDPMQRFNDPDTAHPYGLDPDRDPDFVTPPGSDEAREALVEANAWLSLIADLLPSDDTEREFLGLSDGLPYTQRKEEGASIDGGDLWLPVHDVDDAVEIQREKNKASLAARNRRRIESQKDTFALIAKLAS